MALKSLKNKLKLVKIQQNLTRLKHRLHQNLDHIIVLKPPNINEPKRLIK